MTIDRSTTTLQLLYDEQAVRDLGFRFADACNRGDVDDFRRLWADDGIWTIDDPMNIRAVGADAIADTLTKLRPTWDYFVQMPHAPVVQVDGDRATSRWTVSEQAANASEGRSYFNYARYDDVLIRTPDGWRYLTRRYSYIHLSQTVPTIPAPPRRGPGMH
jgi:ketosteroid isomerase-like protein